MTEQLLQKYFPAFSTREAELRAYGELLPGIREQMIPVVTLTRERDAPSFQESLSSILTAARGNPLIVDFDPVLRPLKTDAEIRADRAQAAAKRKLEGKKPFVPSEKQLAHWQGIRDTTIGFNRNLEALKDSTRGYENWRRLGCSASNLIPVIQTEDLSAVVTQVQELLNAGRTMAFRLRLKQPGALVPFLTAAQAFNLAGKAIVILDAGHIRGAVAGAHRVIGDALKDLRNRLPEPMFRGLLKVCMAGSFPNVLADLWSPLEIQERDLFDLVVSDGWDVRYGDHSSVQPRTPQGGANGWLPHVEVVHPRRWHFYRSDKNTDRQGFIDAAVALVGDPAVWAGRSMSWGTDMVERASRGILDDGGALKLTTPGPWVGVRVSQHLTQQALHP